jgi:hypothetical protein
MPINQVMENSRTPINSSEEAVLEVLEQYLDTIGDDETLTREAAITHLVKQDFERPGARAHIDRLLLKGYLYEVNEELRIPPRP